MEGSEGSVDQRSIEPSAFDRVSTIFEILLRIVEFALFGAVATIALWHIYPK